MGLEYDPFILSNQSLTYEIQFLICNKKLALFIMDSALYYSKKLVIIFEKYVPIKKNILFDLGCGRKPYHDLISQYYQKHIGLEYPSPNHHDDNADIYGSAYHTAIKDQTVDTVFTAAVLEHLENPSEALKEAHRILKKDGLLIITAPLFWHLHDLPEIFIDIRNMVLNIFLRQTGSKYLK